MLKTLLTELSRSFNLKSTSSWRKNAKNWHVSAKRMSYYSRESKSSIRKSFRISRERRLSKIKSLHLPKTCNSMPVMWTCANVWLRLIYWGPKRMLRTKKLQSTCRKSTKSLMNLKTVLLKTELSERWLMCQKTTVLTLSKSSSWTVKRSTTTRSWSESYKKTTTDLRKKGQSLSTCSSNRVCFTRMINQTWDIRIWLQSNCSRLISLFWSC